MTAIASPFVRTRTMRIEDTIWEPFAKRAKSYGLSATAYLKTILIDLNKRTEGTSFYIDSVQSLEVPKKMKPEMKKLANAVTKYADNYR